MTPAEFFAVHNARIRERQQRDERETYLAACIIAATMNASGRYKREAKPEDIFRTATDTQPTKQPRRQQTSEEMLRVAEMMTRALGGRDLREKKEA